MGYTWNFENDLQPSGGISPISAAQATTIVGDLATEVSDAAYAASWDGVTGLSPSKNAVYDKIQTLAPTYRTIVTQASASADITAVQMVNHAHVCTYAGATTLNLPTAAAGYFCSVYASAAQTIHVDVKTGTDVIILNGTALAAGHKVSSDGSINALIDIACFQVGKYIANAVTGTWSDGG